MPLHDYIKKIYQEVDDSLYITRFIDYLLSINYNKLSYTVNTYTVAPLITGVLEDINTKERFYSFSQFYEKASGIKVNHSDINILSKINITKDFNLMRILCNIKENEILGFYDQKYRTFLMYRTIRKCVKKYTIITTNNTNNTNNEINLLWNKNTFSLKHTLLLCKDNPINSYKLLDTYEDGNIKELYYCMNDKTYLITDI
jgi:hypothetical protein